MFTAILFMSHIYSVTWEERPFRVWVLGDSSAGIAFPKTSRFTPAHVAAASGLDPSPRLEMRTISIPGLRLTQVMDTYAKEVRAKDHFPNFLVLHLGAMDVMDTTSGIWRIKDQVDAIANTYRVVS